jgi:hypothetical protein
MGCSLITRGGPFSVVWLCVRGLRTRQLRFAAKVLLIGLASGAVQGDSKSLPISGFTDRLSYAPGESITFHVSSRFPQYFVKIQRLGASRETVWNHEIRDGKVRSVPPLAHAIGAGWPSSFVVVVPKHWRSGYYEAHLGAPAPTEPGNWIDGQTIFFVIRSAAPGKGARILLQLATNTYSAYESWGGASFYAFNSRGTRPSPELSFERPLRSGAHEWEVPFIAWAERAGYAMDYVVNADLEREPSILAGYRLFVSVGHDEYWSAKMRGTLEAFLDSGGNAAFLGGNTMTWQVRLTDGGRKMTAWKEAYALDPVYRPEGPNPSLTTLWSHPLVGRPENMVIGAGVRFGGMHRSHGQLMGGTGAFVTHRPEHWVFDGTGLRENEAFGGRHSVVGYETDGCDLVLDNDRPVPTHRDGTPRSFVILATAPARWPDGKWAWVKDWGPIRNGNACMGIYTRPGGGTVFTAATTDWSHGLRGGDTAVERITRNVLDRLSR